MKAREATRSAKTREKPSTYLQVRGIPMRWREELRRRAAVEGVTVSRHVQDMLETRLGFEEVGLTPLSDAAERLPLKGRRTDLQIRGVTAEFRERLRRQAERRGLSLSQYVVGVIQHYLTKLTRKEFWAQLESRPRVKLPRPAAEYLHEARREEGVED